MIPVFPFHFHENQTRKHAGKKGDTQIDEHRFRYLSHRYFNEGSFQPKPSGQYGNEYPRIDGIKQHLEYGIECNQSGGIFVIAFGEFVPDNNHCNTPRQPYHNQSDHVVRFIWKEYNRKDEHQRRTDNPVLDKRESEDFRISEYIPKLFVPYLCQGRVHHKDETDSDRDIRCPGLEGIPKSGDTGEEMSP